MAVARINIKNIDYFKFKKLVLDANRDDYGSCSKEVKSLCDSVQTLKFRDEEFDDVGDKERFSTIFTYYKHILASKRIEPTDVKIKSGWWGDHKNAYSAGKLKSQTLRFNLVQKAANWASQHGAADVTPEDLDDRFDEPGLYVFKHKEHQCFQTVGRADRLFTRCAERLKLSFDGVLPDPMASLFIISTSADWEFYFIPVGEDDQRVLRILENDLILKHDSIWPHGLNFSLNIDSLLEVSEFRKSCLRHQWPPESDNFEPDVDLAKLRAQVCLVPGQLSLEKLQLVWPQDDDADTLVPSVSELYLTSPTSSSTVTASSSARSASSGDKKQPNNARSSSPAGTVVLSKGYSTPRSRARQEAPPSGPARPASARNTRRGPNTAAGGTRPLSAHSPRTPRVDQTPASVRGTRIITPRRSSEPPDKQGKLRPVTPPDTDPVDYSYSADTSEGESMGGTRSSSTCSLNSNENTESRIEMDMQQKENRPRPPMVTSPRGKVKSSRSPHSRPLSSRTRTQLSHSRTSKAK